jgi:xylulokinase
MTHVDTPAERTRVVCGIDIGSTNTKVVALDATGRVVGRTKRPTPRDPKDLSIDADALFDAIEQMVLEVANDRYLVAAISAAGVGEDGMLVDSSLAPLSRALAWFDPRRNYLFTQLSGRIEEIDGLGVATDPSRTIVGWLWATRQPRFAEASSWIALTDYASARWAGTPFMSDTLAARTAAWQSQTGEWIDDRVTASLTDASLLPPVLRAGDVVGPFGSERLTEAGVLEADAVVIAGGHDHPVGGWGVNLLHPGAILDSMGTAEVVVAQSPTARVRRSNGVDVAPGIRSEGTTLLRVEELARNMDWASQSPDVADELKGLFAGTQQPDGFLDSDVFVPGAQGGGRPKYVANAPRSARSRASAVVGALARLGGQAVDAVSVHLAADARVFAAGGWARSPGWVEIKQAVTGQSVQVVAEPEVTAVGAALLAATGIGWSVSPEIALGARHPVP